jgi:sRNA-binding carbon storage regulator CsrA
MTNLVLTRKAGTSVRLLIGDKTEYVDILDVCGGFCKMRILSTLQVERVRFRDSLQIAEGISVCVVDLAKGHAKLNFTAPREVQILRTELIKEKEDGRH